MSREQTKKIFDYLNNHLNSNPSLRAIYFMQEPDLKVLSAIVHIEEVLNTQEEPHRPLYRMSRLRSRYELIWESFHNLLYGTGWNNQSLMRLDSLASGDEHAQALSTIIHGCMKENEAFVNQFLKPEFR